MESLTRRIRRASIAVDSHNYLKQNITGIDSKLDLKDASRLQIVNEEGLSENPPRKRSLGGIIVNRLQKFGKADLSNMFHIPNEKKSKSKTINVDAGQLSNKRSDKVEKLVNKIKRDKEDMLDIQATFFESKDGHRPRRASIAVVPVNTPGNFQSIREWKRMFKEKVMMSSSVRNGTSSKGSQVETKEGLRRMYQSKIEKLEALLSATEKKRIALEEYIGELLMKLQDYGAPALSSLSQLP